MSHKGPSEREAEGQRVTDGRRGWSDVATNQGMRVAAGSWKCQRNGFSSRASRSSQPCQHFAFSPVGHMLDLASRTVDNKFVLLYLLNLWSSVTAAVGNEPGRYGQVGLVLMWVIPLVLRVHRRPGQCPEGVTGWTK